MDETANPYSRDYIQANFGNGDPQLSRAVEARVFVGYLLYDAESEHLPKETVETQVATRFKNGIKFGSLVVALETDGQITLKDDEIHLSAETTAQIEHILDSNPTIIPRKSKGIAKRHEA